MPTFYNQAALSWDGGITNSNVTTGELTAVLSITKTAATSSYQRGESVTYVVSLVNSGTVPYTGLTVTDNLGTYTVPGGTTEVTPLTYVDGSALYYENGAPGTAPVPISQNPLVFSGITVPAGSNVTLVYEGLVNEFAPLGDGGEITNTVTLAGGGIEPQSDTATVGVRLEPMLTIAKAICPAVVTDNGTITYTLIIQNLGGEAIVATDGVIVSDTFNPILSNIVVTLDGVPLSEGTGYTYDELTGNFATVSGAITVPAATFSQNLETGVVTTTPGTAVITETGTI